jgi:hypothetical protein
MKNANELQLGSYSPVKTQSVSLENQSKSAHKQGLLRPTDPMIIALRQKALPISKKKIAAKNNWRASIDLQQSMMPLMAL